ncbi:hypothetical protein GCM10022270_24010 [Terriglobus aquaticus]
MPIPPKKAAKKAAKKTPGHHDPLKDARRTFEHLGRVQAIANLAQAESEALRFLMHSADIALRAERYKDSADLLRAAEHLCFATLNSSSTEQVSKELKATIAAEFEHLLHRAEDHAAHHEAPDAVVELRKRLTEDAKAALKRGSFRAALEYARGAEALAHVDELDGLDLPAPTAQKRLRA